MSDQPGFKDRIIAWLRHCRLLHAADAAMLGVVMLANSRRNRAFRRCHPDYPLPPASLAYDAYGKVDWGDYDTWGRLLAGDIAGHIVRHVGTNPLDVLEWGCGPGRVIRHLGAMLPGSRLVGSDYNERSIAWCQGHLAGDGLRFIANGLAPPLALEASSLDCIYSISVLTHLSEASHEQWRTELLRLLRPGGILILTTQGDAYRDRYLVGAERQQYAEGELVVRGQYREGKKWFSAFHPSAYMCHAFFHQMQVLEHVPARWEGFPQDLWVARKSNAQKQADVV
jgi:SAM-dependent methyltransferase